MNGPRLLRNCGSSTSLDQTSPSSLAIFVPRFGINMDSMRPLLVSLFGTSHIRLQAASCLGSTFTALQSHRCKLPFGRESMDKILPMEGPNLLHSYRKVSHMFFFCYRPFDKKPRISISALLISLLRFLLKVIEVFDVPDAHVDHPPLCRLLSGREWRRA